MQIGEPLQVGLQHLHLGRLGLAHHDGGVDAGQDVQRVLQKFDGAGTIEEGEGFLEIARRGAVHLDAHLSGARFGARIAHRVFLRDRAFALHRARDGERMLSSSVVLPLP